MCSIITLHPVQSGNRPPVAGSHKTVWKTDHRSPVAGSTISAIWFSSYFSLHKPISRLTVKKLLNLNPRSKNLPGNLTVLGTRTLLELGLSWELPGNKDSPENKDSPGNCGDFTKHKYQRFNQHYFTNKPIYSFQ